MNKITVVVADDHQLVRDGIVHLLQKEADFEVVGLAADGEEAVRLVGEKSPDIVVMDVEMPKVDGVDATKRIKAAHPEVSVVALTIHNGVEYVAALLDAGAAGYLLKTTCGKELVEAIRAVHLGEFVLDSQIGPKVFQDFIQRSTMAGKGMKQKLSDGELETMKLLAQGKTNEKIARQLGISSGAVKDRMSGIFSKLGVGTRTEAIIACLRAHVISLDEVAV